MNKKILVFGIVIILNFSAFFVLANDEFLMIDGGSISGYVRQVNGNPIIDAMVIVMRQDGWWGSVNYTGSDGSYKIDGIPEGDYKIQTFKSGYARLYYNNVFYYCLLRCYIVYFSFHLLYYTKLSMIFYILCQGLFSSYSPS